MQRRMKYISAPPPRSDVLSVSDQVYTVHRCQQNDVTMHIEPYNQNNHPSSKVCFLPPCFKDSIGLTVVLFC